MHTEDLQTWQHDHTFGQDARRPGESRTVLVICITAITMVVEIGSGIYYGSMALLADGMHMASHAVALTISAYAYVYARKHANDSRFSFGTGKVNALGGFSGAVLLSVFALMMAWESSERLIHPMSIAFDQAILVACLGLLVNGVSVFVLKDDDHHHGHDHEEGHHHHGHGEDHNLRAAYLHVVADALTSVLAIGALLAGKYLHLTWMDPLMGIVGAVLVARWSIGLLKTTSSVLLDQQGPEKLRDKVSRLIEDGTSDRVADLHLWAVGPGIFATEVTVVSDQPQPPDHYKALLTVPEIVHCTVEVHQCEAHTSSSTP